MATTFYYQVIWTGTLGKQEPMIWQRNPAFKSPKVRTGLQGKFYSSQKMMPVCKNLKEEDFKHMTELN